MLQATITKDKSGAEVMTIQLPVNVRPSSTGKTTIVASSGGNIALPLQIDGYAVHVGVNCFIKKASEAPQQPELNKAIQTAPQYANKPSV